MMKVKHISPNRIEITGPRGCGKTTKAKALMAELEAQGKCVYIMDGEEYLTPAEQAKYDVVILTKIN